MLKKKTKQTEFKIKEILPFVRNQYFLNLICHFLSLRVGQRLTHLNSNELI